MADVDEKLDSALRRIRDTGVRYAEEIHAYQSRLDLDLGKEDSNSDDSDSSGDDGEGFSDGDETWSVGMGVDWSSNSDEAFDASDVDDHLSKLIFINPSRYTLIRLKNRTS